MEKNQIIYCKWQKNFILLFISKLRGQQMCTNSRINRGRSWFVSVHLKVLYHTGDYSGMTPLLYTEIMTWNGHDMDYFVWVLWGVPLTPTNCACVKKWGGHTGRRSITTREVLERVIKYCLKMSETHRTNPLDTQRRLRRGNWVSRIRQGTERMSMGGLLGK
jgi:hypothetical protein